MESGSAVAEIASAVYTLGIPIHNIEAFSCRTVAHVGFAAVQDDIVAKIPNSAATYQPCDIHHRLVGCSVGILRNMPKIYYVYILASQRRVLYVGMTSAIEHRVFQHKTHAFAGFTAKYNVTNLVYFERHGSVLTAIRREKEVKAWRREEKIKLIESTNPKWRDPSYGWYQRHQYQPDAKVG